jgi:hypothetical protein
VGLYRKLYGTAIEPKILDRSDLFGQFHGSIVRDIFIEYAVGRFCVDDHAEKLLQELVADGELEVLQRAPTHSQAAFAGLGYSSEAYRRAPWGPGFVEHHWYRWKDFDSRKQEPEFKVEHQGTFGPGG